MTAAKTQTPAALRPVGNNSATVDNNCWLRNHMLHGTAKAAQYSSIVACSYAGLELSARLRLVDNNVTVEARETKLPPWVSLLLPITVHDLRRHRPAVTRNHAQASVTPLNASSETYEV